MGSQFAADALRRIARRRSVILGYHGIGQAPPGEDVFRLLVSPQRFTGQLELLTAAGFRFVTVAELARRLDREQPPPGLAAITFDDGLRNNHATALPILQRLGIPATVYVTTGLIGGQSPWLRSASEGAMLDADEIRALAAAGWEIAAHTVSHADLSTLDYAACRQEIDASRATLAALTGGSIETFAYPYGRCGEAAVAAVRDSGFLAAVTTGSGRWSRFELTRAMVSAGDPLPVLLLKLTDRYEPLLDTAPLRVARTASKRIRAMLGGLSHDTDPARPPAY